MRKGQSNSLKYDMRTEIYEADLSDQTTKGYIKSTDAFASYCKMELGIKTTAQLDAYGRLDAVQRYADHLVESGKTAATVHTYISGVCKAIGTKIADVEKPQRSVADITRGRVLTDRTLADRQNPKYQRVVSGARCIGIRDSELAKLEGRDLKVKDNEVFVRVRSGKGGKQTLQRILPQHRAEVLELFDGIKPHQKVYTKSELASDHLGTHAYRREVAQESYQHYLERVKDPKQKAELRRDLIARFNLAHPGKKYEKEREAFLKELEGTYTVRGANRQRFEDNGLPISYDRFAMMCVSVYHLSHWRLDVTVENYFC